MDRSRHALLRALILPSQKRGAIFHREVWHRGLPMNTTDASGADAQKADKRGIRKFHEIFACEMEAILL